MLKHQPWSLGSTAPALCPKCNMAALYRSHTHTTLEEKRKQYGAKRPYRCHECGWRGWIEEPHLRYSSETISYRSKDTVTQDIAIPDIQLDDNNGNAHSTQHDRKEAGNVDVGPRNGSVIPSPTPPQNTDADRTVAQESRAADGMQERETATSEDDESRLPDFVEDATKIASTKVPVGFHHHSRHTIKTCTKCGEPSLYRSRSRSLGETIKKKLTIKRPYRCHKCGWRGWLSRGF